MRGGWAAFMGGLFLLCCQRRTNAEQPPYACTSTADCADGFHCAAGLCVTSEVPEVPGDGGADAGACAAGDAGVWCRCYGAVARPASLVWSQCADGFTSVYAGPFATPPIIGERNSFVGGLTLGTGPQWPDAGSIASADYLGVAGASDRGRLVGRLLLHFSTPDSNTGLTELVWVNNGSGPYGRVADFYVAPGLLAGAYADSNTLFDIVAATDPLLPFAPDVTHTVDMRWQRTRFLSLRVDGQPLVTAAGDGAGSPADAVGTLVQLGPEEGFWDGGPGLTAEYSDWLYFNDPDGGL